MRNGLKKEGRRERVTSPISVADSRMWTVELPARRHDMAAPTPPRPAPTMIIFMQFSRGLVFI